MATIVTNILGICRDWAIGSLVAATLEFIFDISGNSPSSFVQIFEGLIQLSLTITLCVDLQGFLKILNYNNPHGLIVTGFFALFYSNNMLLKLRGVYNEVTTNLLLVPGGFYSKKQEKKQE